MSLLWMDGFDGYSTNNNTDVQSIINSAGYVDSGFTDVTVSTDTRTNVGMSIIMGAFGHLVRAFVEQSSVITGFALKMGGSGYSQFFEFHYNTYLGNEYQMVQFNVNTNGAITAVIYNKSGAIVTSYHSLPNVLFPNTWQYVEIEYTPSATSGIIIVKVDGVSVISETGVQTVSTDITAQINMCGCFNNNSGAIAVHMDDWYILANDSSGLSSFQGDVVVHAVFPDSDATPNAMSQFGGTVGHWTTVSDPNASDDTAYLYSSTASQQEMFGLAPFPTDLLDVLAVGVSVRAKKDSAGIADFEIKATVGANTTTSPSLVTTTTYLTQTMLMETEPGGGAWTLTDAQNMTVGFETV